MYAGAYAFGKTGVRTRQTLDRPRTARRASSLRLNIDRQ
jgi:hypothetical protein